MFKILFSFRISFPRQLITWPRNVPVQNLSCHVLHEKIYRMLVTTPKPRSFLMIEPRIPYQNAYMLPVFTESKCENIGLRRSGISPGTSRGRWGFYRWTDDMRVHPELFHLDGSRTVFSRHAAWRDMNTVVSVNTLPTDGVTVTARDYGVIYLF